MQYLTIWDLVLTPIYLLILIAIAKKQRDERYPKGHALRKYYMPGLYVKFGGAVFIGLVYQYYYGGGDTFNYFKHSQIINSSLDQSVSIWLKLITHTSPDSAPEIYQYTSQMYWYNAPSEYFVAVIAALLGLLNGTTYIPIALLFAFFAYTGIWALFRTFVNIYPTVHKHLAYAFLFIPSSFVWGSGIFKDTICMFGLGWLTYTTFRIFISKDLSFRNLLLLITSFYLVAQIKLYILLGFLPALSFWLLMTYSRHIHSSAVKWFVNLVFVCLTTGGFLFFTNRFAKELNKYSLDNISKTAEVTRNWTNYAAGEEGSVYNIGTIDGSLGSMVTMFPQAVIVTLFRPFPWETKKPIMVLSAMESLLFLYFTIRVFFNRRSKLFRNLFRDPNVLFCFIFSIIFAFAVGAASGNFGALSRYKIPCIPFYGAVLAILWSKQNTAIIRYRPTVHHKKHQPAI